MKTPWYMPSGNTIWIIPCKGEEPRYVRWFNTRKDALKYGNWRRDRCHGELLMPPLRVTCLSKGTIPVSLDQPVGWVLFDADNGDELSKRYCWLFYTRQEARTMRTRHMGSPNLTRLVGPFQIGY